MNNLRLEKILDFYDEPQIFTGRDKFDAQYICLLYSDSPECKYTAVKISSNRLKDFLDGKEDLRNIFTNPEDKGEYFDVVYYNNKYEITNLKETSLPEDKLPYEGYRINADAHETVTVNLPVKDHGLFTELINKFGWACM